MKIQPAYCASLPLWMLGEDIYFGKNSDTAVERARRERGARRNRDGTLRHRTCCYSTDTLKCEPAAAKRLQQAMEAW